MLVEIGHDTWVEADDVIAVRRDDSMHLTPGHTTVVQLAGGDQFSSHLPVAEVVNRVNGQKAWDERKE